MKSPMRRNRFRAWGRRQLYSFFSSLGTLLSHRLGTLMTVLVLGIAMLLPMSLYLLLGNLRTLDLQQESWGAMTVFLKPEIGSDQARALAEGIESQYAASAQPVSPEQGMREFRDASGFGQALEVFEESPLPWVLLVTPSVGADQNLAAQSEALAAWLGNQRTVDFVQVDYRWLRRLASLLALGNAVATLLALLFSLAVIVVVANTIRLDVAGRAEEIQVMSLVGAGNSFIRQPFLYTGFWYGLLGALLALILLNLCLLYLHGPMEELMDAYGKRMQLHGLGTWRSLLVLLAGGTLGFLGAWIAVQRHLRALRPGVEAASKGP